MTDTQPASGAAPATEALKHIIECVRPNTTAGAMPERTVDTNARILADHLTAVARRGIEAEARAAAPDPDAELRDRLADAEQRALPRQDERMDR